VRLDRVGDRRAAFRCPAQPFQQLLRFFRGEARGLGSQRAVLFHRHAIVQDHGRCEDFRVAAFAGLDAGGTRPHPDQMGQIV